jgi:hypothetical protein
MREIYEISDRFIPDADANALLYEPLDGGLRFRRTRRYGLFGSGETGAMERFVRTTLFDEISQDLHVGETPALSGAAFILEYGMKPSALDLEKEAIVRHYRGLIDPGFNLEDLVIRQRIYLFGAAEAKAPVERFVRDICNPAVHHWQVISAHV